MLPSVDTSCELKATTVCSESVFVSSPTAVKSVNHFPICSICRKLSELKQVGFHLGRELFLFSLDSDPSSMLLSTGTKVSISLKSIKSVM